MATTLERRIEALEAEAHGPARTIILMPDESGRHPEPPPGAVRVIQVEFVEAPHADT